MRSHFFRSSPSQRRSAPMLSASAYDSTSAIRQSQHSRKPARYSALHSGQNTRHAGGAPSTISRIISRANISSSAGTYKVLSLPRVSTRTGISFSFSASLKKFARSPPAPDHTAQLVTPNCAGLVPSAAGADESSAESSISTGSSPKSFSRIFSASAKFDA